MSHRQGWRQLDEFGVGVKNLRSSSLLIYWTSFCFVLFDVTRVKTIQKLFNLKMIVTIAYKFITPTKILKSSPYGFRVTITYKERALDTAMSY